MDGKEEIITKLAQIEEQARILAAEVPASLPKDRARLIIGIAGYLRTRVEMRWDQSASNQGGDPAQSRTSKEARGAA